MSTEAISSAYAMFCNPNGARKLAKDFTPGKYDVLCARGKKAHESEGNRRFRALVKLHQTKYAACSCKVEKSKIVSHIVSTVRNASPNGGFVKIIDGAYWEAGDRAAKEKVGQTFRDFLHTKYSSSTKAKARARMEKKDQEQPQSLDTTFHARNLNMDMSFEQNMIMRRFQAQQVKLEKTQDSSASMSSDDSLSNHTAMDDSSNNNISPTPQKTLYVETPQTFPLQPEPISVVDSLRRSSILSLEGRRGGVHDSLRSSNRSSLLRSSIHTIDEAQGNLLRGSFISFGPGMGPLRTSNTSMRGSMASLTPLPLMEGAIINIGGNNNGNNAPMMSNIERDFASNMEMDENLDEDLQEFYGNMGVAV